METTESTGNFKFNHGDRVRIKRYGHLAWFSKKEPQPTSFPLIGSDEHVNYYDVESSLVGRTGEIQNRLLSQATEKYGVRFDDGRYISWFSLSQLELISKANELHTKTPVSPGEEPDLRAGDLRIEGRESSPPNRVERKKNVRVHASSGDNPAGGDTEG